MLCDSRVQVAGDVRDLLAAHHRLLVPRGRLPAGADAGMGAGVDAGVEIIRVEDGSAIVRSRAGAPPPAYPVELVTLEELALAYMTRAIAVPPAREVAR
ncbi:hypothetical protein ACIHCQ_34890 [Streptomyces sp. NPDC052236]|uniref:hypothetical protein n=1 Tax=Streptomyces sp. NPDC052236 TaxID=3365686 RepID=UPI0037D3FFC8